MSEFLQKYLKARDEKNSTLCIGLDPAVPGLRKENTMPDNDIMGFCTNIIEKTSPYACAFKTNSQYILFNLGMEQLQELNHKIHKAGSVSILDHKLSDIGSSNLAAIHSAGKAGFDAITFSPFAGYIKEAVNQCHISGLGIFVLTLMSNPEARIQKEFSLSGTPLYQWIATEAKEADGLVVGLTNNATETEIRKIREIAGKDMILLCPGLGAQSGNTDKLPAGNSLVNVGRDIIYSKDPVKKASEFAQLLKP